MTTKKPNDTSAFVPPPFPVHEGKSQETGIEYLKIVIDRNMDFNYTYNYGSDTGEIKFGCGTAEFYLDKSFKYQILDLAPELDKSKVYNFQITALNRPLNNAEAISEHASRLISDAKTKIIIPQAAEIARFKGQMKIAVEENIARLINVGGFFKS